MDIIEKKKAQFFVARDADKLAIQKETLQQQKKELSSERRQAEEVRKLQNDIRQEQQRLDQARPSAAKQLLSGLRGLRDNKGGMNEKAAANRDRMNHGIGKGTLDFTTGPKANNDFSLSNSGPFSGKSSLGAIESRGPFSNDVTSKPAAAPKQQKKTGRSVTIHFK